MYFWSWFGSSGLPLSATHREVPLGNKQCQQGAVTARWRAIHSGSRVALSREKCAGFLAWPLSLCLRLEPLCRFPLLACAAAPLRCATAKSVVTFNHCQGAIETGGIARGYVTMPVVLLMTHSFYCFIGKPDLGLLLVSEKLNVQCKFTGLDYRRC